MQAEFWHERWEKGEIGFHQHDFNYHMRSFIDRLQVPAGAHILVPLCGKSLDMLWLAHRGFQVTGIEISELAASAFFLENGLDHEVAKQPESVTWRGEGVTILCTDFFTVQKADLGRVDAVYDRASLIALPPDMRQEYARHLAGLLDNGVCSLLVTLDYPQDEMRGPPFSVPPEEVRSLFGEHYGIQHLHAEDCLANEPRFRKKGLTRLDEHVWRLKKQPA